MRQKPLLKATFDLINAEAELSSREIAAGAGVGYEWFIKFWQGHIDSPGVQRVQAVHDFLLNGSSSKWQ